MATLKLPVFDPDKYTSHGMRRQYRQDTSAIQSLVCESCWAGPFSYENFRIACSRPGFRYKTAWEQLVAHARTGQCNWCGIIVSEARKCEPEETGPLEGPVEVNMLFWEQGIGITSGRPALQLTIMLANGKRICVFPYPVYTTCG